MIRVSQLSKLYKIYPSARDRLREWGSFGRVKRHTDFWALRNFNLEVPRSQCVGIIGPNGAGKSTLLKILSGVSTLTSGSYEIAGRVLSLLELGTGFVGELTGRQNVLETAALLGFSTADVRGRMEMIAAFADLGDFFDRPLRTYSSGMVVRLAFAAFVNLDPDVFIIDEALAVGDAGFARKCYRHLENLLRRGVTCLMVTHDLPAVIRFCDRAVVLDHGQTLYEGDARTACNVLSKIYFGQAETQSATDYGDASASIERIWFEDENGKPILNAREQQRVVYCYEVAFARDVSEPVCGAHIKSLQGVEIMLASTDYLHENVGAFSAGERATFRWTLDLNLNPGSYFFGCGVKHPDREAFMCRRVDAMKFVIADVQRVGGLINPFAGLKIDRQAINSSLAVAR